VISTQLKQLLSLSKTYIILLIRETLLKLWY